MKIAIVGAGRMGSLFALLLGKAGHEITLVARGTRLTELVTTPVLVGTDGSSARVSPANGFMRAGRPRSARQVSPSSSSRTCTGSFAATPRW